MLHLVVFVTVALFQVQAAPFDFGDAKPQYLGHIEDLSRTCALELKITEKLPSTSDGQFPEDNAVLSSLFGCVFEKLEIVNVNAEINDDKLKEFVVNVSTMFIPEIIKNCKGVEGKNYGQKAIKLQNCLVLHNMELLKKYYTR